MTLSQINGLLLYSSRVLCLSSTGADVEEESLGMHLQSFVAFIAKQCVSISHSYPVLVIASAYDVLHWIVGVRQERQRPAQPDEDA